MHTLPAPVPGERVGTASRALAVALGVGLAALFLAPAAHADDLRLGESVAPTFARIVLELDPARTDYRGVAHFDLDVREATPVVRFHAEEMELERIELRRAGEREPIAVTRRDLPGARVELAPTSSLVPGAYTLELDFSNDFGTRAVGLYRAVHRGDPYLFTQFEAIDAREAFPCWDEPGFKHPWQLVLTVPEGQVAATNGPIVARHAEAGRETLTFERTPPLSSYLVAIAVGPFDVAEIPGMSIPGRVLAPRGMGPATAEAVAATPPLLVALEAYFGRPYPFSKLDLVAVPEYWFGAMENPGLITFADHILLLDPARSSAGQRARLAEIDAHELAHMWFGDLVTMAWWDDLWLNEAFADWLATKIVDRVRPDHGVGLADLHAVQATLDRDGRPASPAIRREIRHAEEALESVGLAYNKGRAVLQMVEGWLGEETFRRGVVDYVGRHAGGSAVAADLWNALARASGEPAVVDVLASFLDQPGYPLLEVRRLDGGTGPHRGRFRAVEVRQRRYAAAGVELPPQRWTVPFVLRWGAGDERGTTAVVLRDETTRVDLGREVDWVLPGAGGGGYYRWRIELEDVDLLASRATALLTPPERIAFLGNAGALLDAGLLGGDRYLSIVEAFAADPEPEVTVAVVEALAEIERAFVDEPLRDPFAGYVRRVLAPAAARLGWEPRPDETGSTTELRPRLFAWLGDQGGDLAVRGRAAGLAAAFSADPASVDPSLAEDALRVTAIDGDAALFELYRARFEATADPADRRRWLAALGSFRRPELRDRALAYTLEGPLRPTEVLGIPALVAEGPGGPEVVWPWVAAHYDPLAARLPPEFLGSAPRFAGGCSADLLAAARAFFADPAHQGPATLGHLERTAAQVEECVRLREREGARVAGYLQSASGSGSPS